MHLSECFEITHLFVYENQPRPSNAPPFSIQNFYVYSNDPLDETDLLYPANMPSYIA